MLNFIIWIGIGALVGWLASLIYRTHLDVVTMIVVGIIGSFLAGWVLTPLFGVAPLMENSISFPGLIVSVLGAILLLFIVSLFYRLTR